MGQTLSRGVFLDSGVPQGSVLAPPMWNYHIGDMPTMETAHSDNSIYADDAHNATSHPQTDRALTYAQTEIHRLNDWTEKKRWL